MGGNTKQAANDGGRRGRASTPGRGLHSARAAAGARLLDGARQCEGGSAGPDAAARVPSRLPRRRLRRTCPPRAQSPRAAGGLGALGVPWLPHH